MKNVFKIFVPFLIVIMTFFSMNQGDTVGAASKYEDGEYSVPFTVLKGDSDERSMTNDYVTSPAKLVVKDGKNLVQITIKNSSWWQYFKVNGQDVTVLSEDAGADTRLVQFEVQDLDQIVPSKIHVIVPDIDYDNHYDIRFQFDTSNVPGASGSSDSGETNKEEGTNSGAGNKEGGEKGAEKNPPTGDNAPILLLGLMVVGSGIFLVRKLATE
ncbi:heme uptake protein IsdC [Pseudogracilibacillus sp. SO30301A]|uniref:heme uptake protein IsdC n=1 Tax=Pseudogracilibacillus sp. SO30301A TaxID=3098291 RepID=UPI00300E4766